MLLFNCSAMFYSLWPHGLWHVRLLCPLLSPAVCSNSYPLNRWCHPTILSSVISSSSWLQYFPASGSFSMSPFFASGGQSIGASASASVLPMNSQDWFPLGWTGLISLQSKGLSRIFSSLRVFSNDSSLRIRWPKYWSFSFNVSPSNEYSGLISFRIDWLDLLAVQFSSVAQSCLTLCNPMDCSTPGSSVPPLSPGVCSNPCSLSQWCHPTISSSIALFSSLPQSFPESGSFPLSWLFESGGLSIGVSAWTSIPPMNTQDWSP